MGAGVLARAAARRARTPVLHTLYYWAAPVILVSTWVCSKSLFSRDTVIVRLKRKRRADPKFAAQAGRKPDAILLPPVVDREAETRKVGTHKFSDAERQRLRELRENVNRLELLGVDIGLARPIRVLIVLWSERNVVSLAALRKARGR